MLSRVDNVLLELILALELLDIKDSSVQVSPLGIFLCRIKSTSVDKCLGSVVGGCDLWEGNAVLHSATPERLDNAGDLPGAHWRV